MANNYQQSSFQIDLRSEEEGKFLIEKMEDYESIVNGDYDEDREFTDQEKQVYEEGWGWSYEKEDNQLVIYCEENGQTDVMAELLQEFLIKFRPNEYILFTYSYTCSKMRPNQFGGGGVLVTEDEIEFLDARNELEKLVLNMGYE